MPVSTNKGNAKGKIAAVCARLRQDILAGHLEPGSPFPSPDSLSRQHGVARATVSVALGRLVEQGYAIRVPRRGTFVPEQLPSSHEILDFVRLQSPVDRRNMGWVLKWIERFSHVAEAGGWTPRWHHLTDEQAANLEEFADGLISSKGVVTFYLMPWELPWMLAQRGVPVVSVHKTRGGIGLKPECYPQVSYDRQELARIATEHLARLGYTRIGYIGSASDSQNRLAGFLDVARKYKLTIHSDWLFEFDWSVKDLNGLHTQVRRSLKAENCPEALCCETRDVALAARSVASDLGLRIPEDLALIACDIGDQEMPGDIGITTVSVSMAETCGKALEVLGDLRAQPKSEYLRLWEPAMMPLHLEVKDSCGAKIKGLCKESTEVRDAQDRLPGVLDA